MNSKDKKTLPLTSISPIDGRYWKDTNVFSEYFSEYALFKTRVEVEIEYLIFLSVKKICPKISKSKKKALKNIYLNFTLKDAEKVKKLEDTTHHDVKAVEYFIADYLKKLNLPNLRPYLHFSLTSDDVNNVSYRLMTERALLNIVLPQLKSQITELKAFSKKYASTPMLARTHGQAAVPTTLGKEVAVFIERINSEVLSLSEAKFKAKFGGAVGNWNAHRVSYPKIDWIKESTAFLKTLGLKHSKVTTQIAPAEDLTAFFQNVIRINLIFLDLSKDMWRYISDGWIVKRKEANEVGSSTMPQKVNPINFENSEGNLEIANSLFETLVKELPISRLQRDLSDSTILRNIGLALAHSYLAYKNTQKGFSKIEVNKTKMRKDLFSNWNILFEALQTILRKNGDLNAYEKAASLATKRKLDKEGWQNIVNSFELPKRDKETLLELTPETYLGFAERTAKNA